MRTIWFLNFWNIIGLQGDTFSLSVAMLSCTSAFREGRLGGLFLVYLEQSRFVKLHPPPG